MGATLVAGGATFRAWAPRAREVHVLGDFNGWRRDADSRLHAVGNGHWAGFVATVGERAAYKFYVIGTGGERHKRDPYARDLSFDPPFPFSNCLVLDPGRFPWHDAGFTPPPFHELVVYQLHVGTFSPAPGSDGGTFLDVLDRLPYLVALGVNAIQPLPIAEFPTDFSLGYNGTDYFSPETDYAVPPGPRLDAYVARVNGLLAARGQGPYRAADVTEPADQLRALVDTCHVYGLAVILDVVYNHAGGGFDAESLYFFDEAPRGDNNDSLYFTDQGWAGGLVFAYWKRDVRQFLIDNAVFLLREYHADGFRYDEVSVIDRYGGWDFCRDLTATCRVVRPGAIQIAEYWPVNAAVTNATVDGGAGFDATWHDGLRDSARAALEQAAGGRDARVDMSRVARALAPSSVRDAWRAVQGVENHDIVKAGEHPRVARLADPSNARSWYARSRARVATGLLLTAPGIPMLFMGQEFLEDKPWKDEPRAEYLIWWAGLEGGDKAMADHLRFTQDLVALRRREPALSGSGLNVFHVHDGNRVIAFHRWRPGIGGDVVVVATLSETTWYGYELGFPRGGRWREAFNSDVYDNWVNPAVAGNGGGVDAAGPPRHDLPASAAIVLPANAVVVFTPA
jgi:1,4-alpha-glucan branching enzyme